MTDKISVKLPGGRVVQAEVTDDEVDLDTEVITLGDGTRLTTERAEEWADEYERREITKGRPSLHGGTGPSPRIGTRVPRQLLDRVDALAEAQGIDRAKLLRFAIEEYVNAHPATSAAPRKPARRVHRKA
jgi:hypothetical protein